MGDKSTDTVGDIPGFVAHWSHAGRRAGGIRHAVGAAHLKAHQFTGPELQTVAVGVRRGNHGRLARRIVQMVGGHHRGRHGCGRQEQTRFQRLQHKRIGAGLTTVALIEQFLEFHG